MVIALQRYYFKPDLDKCAPLCVYIYIVFVHFYLIDPVHLSEVTKP